MAPRTLSATSGAQWIGHLEAADKGVRDCLEVEACACAVSSYIRWLWRWRGEIGRREGAGMWGRVLSVVEDSRIDRVWALDSINTKSRELGEIFEC
jgi:hypothetical protein